MLIIVAGFSLAEAQELKLPLYQGQVPNALRAPREEIVEEKDGMMKLWKVESPEIAVFFPSRKYATGEAVIICPGGAYHMLAYDLEGTDIASYLVSKGITAIVLKYRLPAAESSKVRWESPLLDAERAVRIVRSQAKEWGLKPDRIGVMGFSAGGHLASTLSTHFSAENPQAKDPVDRFSSRPDFSWLVYPVISFSDALTHMGSRKNLLGQEWNNSDLVHHFSNELQVKEDTPPAILIHGVDDQAVNYKNSMVYFEACQQKGVHAAMFLYPQGAHGFGLAVGQEGLSGWLDQCIAFTRGLPTANEAH